MISAKFQYCDRCMSIRCYISDWCDAAYCDIFDI